MQASNQWWQEVAAFVGLDWADQFHCGCLIGSDLAQAEHFKLEQKPEALKEWIAQLRVRFGGKKVAVALEQSKGALINGLMGHEFLILVPINPKSLAAFRETFKVSGAKDDPSDAALLLELLRAHHRKLRAWIPDDEQTRALRLLTEQRRKLVDQRTALTNELSSCLKEYFPQALGWLKNLTDSRTYEFLSRWPSLQALQQAKPAQVRKFFSQYRCKNKQQFLDARVPEIGQAVALTSDFAVLTAHTLTVQALVAQLPALDQSIEKFDEKIAEVFDQHPDSEIFQSLPGAGAVMAPRLLAVFGSQRDRFENVQQVQAMTGTAPVLKRSGKTVNVHRRVACSTFIKQSCHEFAQYSIPQCDWARAFYQLQRSRGKGHHAAIRSLAFKWNRVIYTCWLTRTAYDEQKYLDRLRQRRSPLAAMLTKSAQIAKSA